MNKCIYRILFSVLFITMVFGLNLAKLDQADAQVTSQSSTPAIPYTVSYQVSEDESVFTQTTPTPHIYNGKPTTLLYSFVNKTPGLKTIWVRFTDSNGKTADQSIKVRIVAPATTSSLSKRVFVTHAGVRGDINGTFGITGANAFCQSQADSAGLGGIWKAWLSNEGTSAADNIVPNSGAYTLVDNTTVVATSWSDLISGSLLHAINQDQFGNQQDGVVPWTNTNPDGSINSTTSNCNHWTSASHNDTSSAGQTNSINSNWTIFTTVTCDTYKPLYCFEQGDMVQPLSSSTESPVINSPTIPFTNSPVTPVINSPTTPPIEELPTALPTESPTTSPIDTIVPLPTDTSSPTSAPYTVSYQVSEDDVNFTAPFAYNGAPSTLLYDLKDTTPGLKTIWVRFTDSNGNTSDQSTQVWLVSPTVSPTAEPTITPTVTPTIQPTIAPTISPTTTPTTTPTAVPTVPPTSVPTVAPTTLPTIVPTITPTIAPTAIPTIMPTASPTSAPYTVSYQISENGPIFTNTTAYPYNGNPTTLLYNFVDQTPGLKTLWVRFTDSNGNTSDQSTQVLLVAPPSTNSIAYFPVGVFEDAGYGLNVGGQTPVVNFQTLLTDIKSRGFNSVMLVNGNFSSYGPSLLSLSDQMGINVFMGPMYELDRQWWPNTVPATQDQANQVIQPLVDKVQNHPSLKGYYVADEPPVSSKDKVALAVQTFKKFDPNRLAMVDLNGLPNIGPIFTAAQLDVLLMDIYRVGTSSPPCTLSTGGVNGFTGYIRGAISQAKASNNPLWVILQAHGGASFGLRQPTPPEARMQNWLAIGEGAKGIFWFLYTSQPNPAITGFKDNPALYDELTTLAKRTTALAPTLLGLKKSAAEDFSISSSSGYISTLNSLDGTKHYAVAVNTTCSTQSFAISSTTYAGSLRDLETGEVIPLGGTVDLQPGDGKIFELIQPQTFDVTQFGAKGDGTTDDTIAIQTAINQAQTVANGATVYFPSGTYIVSAHTPLSSQEAESLKNYYGLRINSGNINMTGSNATIKLKDNQPDSTSVLVIGGLNSNFSNVSVTDLTFDGNAMNQPEHTEIEGGVFILGNQLSNIHFDHNTVENIRTRGDQAAIDFHFNITNSSIIGNKVTGITDSCDAMHCNAAGIFLDGGHDILVQDNYIDTPGDNGIASQANADNGSKVTQLSDIQTHNNTFQDNTVMYPGGTSANRFDGMAINGSFNIIEGNKIVLGGSGSGWGMGIYLTAYNPLPSSHAVNNNTVTNNQVTGGYYGIYLNGSLGCDGSTHKGSGCSVGDAINGQIHADNNMVETNTILGNPLRGIYLGPVTNNNQTLNNTIQVPGTNLMVGISPSAGTNNTISPNTLIPQNTPVPSPSVSTTPYTVSYQISENGPIFTNATPFPYNGNPTTLLYNFVDKTPGLKTIWVRFTDSNGNTSDQSAQVLLVAPVYPTWTNYFPIGAYVDAQHMSAIGSGAQAYVQTSAQDMIDHHFDTLLFNNNSLRLGTSQLGDDQELSWIEAVNNQLENINHPLNVIYSPTTELINAGFWNSATIPASGSGSISTVVNGIVSKLKTHPSLKGYNIVDEPYYSSGGIPVADRIKSVVDAFKQQDPNHPALPVLTGLNTNEQNIPQLVSDIQPQTVMIDPYPYGVNNAACNTTMSAQGYPYVLTDYIQKALVTKPTTTPFWVILQAHQWSNPENNGAFGLRLPNDAELNLETWLSIGEGAKGIFWFIYNTPQIDDIKGFKSGGVGAADYGEISDLAQRLQVLKPTLINLQKDTTNPVHLSSAAVTDLYTSTLINNSSSQQYVVVVNQKCTTQTYKFDTLASGVNLQDLESNATYTANNSITLAAGEGRVLRIGNVVNVVPHVEPPYNATKDGYTEDVQAWWLQHPLNNGMDPANPGNPLNPNAVTIVPPTDATTVVTDVAPGSNSLQLAINTATMSASYIPGPNGTKLVFKLHTGDYGILRTLGLSNMYFIADPPALQAGTNPHGYRAGAHIQNANISGCPLAENVNLFDAAVRAAVDNGNNSAAALTCLRDGPAKAHNIYFKNVVFDGAGVQKQGLVFHAVSDVVADNVVFQNYYYPNDPTKNESPHEESMMQSNASGNNIWCRNCIFLGGFDPHRGTSYGFFQDGSHGSGVINSTFDGYFGTGDVLFQTNDDFSTKDANTWLLTGQRNGQYDVVYNNTINQAIHSNIRLTASDTLIAYNKVTQPNGDMFVYMNPVCSHIYANKGLSYNNFHTTIVHNTIAGINNIACFDGENTLNDGWSPNSAGVLAYKQTDDQCLVMTPGKGPIFGQYDIENNTVNSLPSDFRIAKVTAVPSTAVPIMGPVTVSGNKCAGVDCPNPSTPPTANCQ